jgi:sugar phosphate isomerase/epimerase
MQLSVTSWSFPACSLAEVQGITAALGFSAMDLGLFHGAALDKAAVLADPEGMARGLRASGVRAANVYWLFGAGLAERAVTVPDARAANAADLDRVARFAAEMGAGTIFVLPGVSEPGVSQDALIGRAAESLRSLLPVAAAHGVQLTVEPHVGGILASPEATLRLLEKVPGLKLTLDYAHFVCIGFTQGQIDVLAPHAAHVHLRQARPGALQAKWGEGVLDFSAMVEVLRGAGYEGWLSVEYVHQAYMNTLFDDVLTETVRMRDEMRRFGIR